MSADGPLVQEHLQKPGVVRHGGYHPATARFPSPRHAWVIYHHVLADAPILGEGLSEPGPFQLVFDIKARVLHFERVKNTFLLEDIERLARDDLDHTTQN